VRSFAVWGIDEGDDDIINKITGIEIVTISRKRFWFGK